MVRRGRQLLSLQAAPSSPSARRSYLSAGLGLAGFLVAEVCRVLVVVVWPPLALSSLALLVLATVTSLTLVVVPALVSGAGLAAGALNCDSLAAACCASGVAAVRTWSTTRRWTMTACPTRFSALAFSWSAVGSLVCSWPGNLP